MRMGSERVALSESCAAAHARRSDFVNNLVIRDNVINSYGPGMWLGVAPVQPSDPPSLFINNWNVAFVNNTLANCATTPMLLTSAANVSVVNTTFLDVLCTQEETTNFGPWQVPGALLMIANAENVTLSGNRAIRDARCVHAYGNYSQPVALVNATNVLGLSGLTNSGGP
jgi:hypothetical protein